MSQGEVKLTGNTLRVYLYALKKRKVGVREVQRSLRFSHASLAQYHLNKLKDLGLVTEVEGYYEVSGEVKVDVMRDFLRIGSLLVPRFVFYAVFFSTLAAYFAYEGVVVISSSLLLWPTVFLTAASVIFWYEAARAWKSAAFS